MNKKIILMLGIMIILSVVSFTSVQASCQTDYESNPDFPDWNIGEDQSCSSEVLNITGNLQIVGSTEVPVTQFSSGTNSAYDLRGNSTTIVSSIPDLNPSTPSEYTENWEQTFPHVTFKIVMNESENKISMYAQNNNRSGKDMYFPINLDNNVSTGGNGGISGTDLIFGELDAFGNEVIGCYNSTLANFDAMVIGGSGSGVVHCGNFRDSSYPVNFTVYYNISNVGDNSEFEIVVDDSNKTWQDKYILADDYTFSQPGYTLFKNIPVNTIGTVFNVSDSTINIEGELRLWDGLNYFENSEIIFNNSGSLEVGEFFGFFFNAYVEFTDVNVTSLDNSSYYQFGTYGEGTRFVYNGGYVDHVNTSGFTGLYLQDNYNAIINDITFGEGIENGNCINSNVGGNHTVYNNICNLTGGYGINYGSNDSHYYNNILNYLNPSGIDIVSGNLLENNTMSIIGMNTNPWGTAGNTYLNNILINANMNFYNTTIHNNTWIFNNSFGEMKWILGNSSITNGGNYSIGNNFYVQQNLIGLANNDQLVNFNTTAYLKFYNIGFVEPAIFDGDVYFTCDASNNCTFDSINDIVYLNVTHFSNYTVYENLTFVNPLTPSNNSFLNNGTGINFSANFSSGTAVDNGTLYVYNDTGLVNQTTTGIGGFFSGVLSTILNLFDGIYTWFYQLIDSNNDIVSNNAGNSTLTVDTTSPVITLTSPINGTYFNTNNISLNYSMTDLTRMDIVFNNGTVNESINPCIMETVGNSSCTNGFNIVSANLQFPSQQINDSLYNTFSDINSSLSDDVYSYSVNYSLSTDPALINTTWVVKYENDTGTFTNQVVVPKDSNNYNLQCFVVVAKFTFTFNSVGCELFYNNGSSVNLLLLNGEQSNFFRFYEERIEHVYDYTNYTEDRYLNLSEGQENYTFYATDEVGFSSSEEVTFFIDTTTPMVNITSPLNQTYLTNEVLINISANDTNLDTILYNWNGTNVTYNSPINVNFTNGFQTLEVWVNDSAGNINYSQVNFTTVSLIISSCSRVLTTPAYYNLNSDLSCSNNGIIINSDDITVDLNGFRINATNSSIVIGNYSNVTILNGTLGNESTVYGVFGMDGTSTCFQESFNVSNQSGTDGNCELNYSGGLFSLGSGASSYTYTVKYIKPINSIGAISRFYFGFNESVNESVNIPSICYHSNKDYILLKYSVGTDNLMTFSTFELYCDSDGDDILETQIYTNTTSAVLGGSQGGGEFQKIFDGLYEDTIFRRASSYWQVFPSLATNGFESLGLGEEAVEWVLPSNLFSFKNITTQSKDTFLNGYSNYSNLTFQTTEGYINYFGTGLASTINQTGLNISKNGAFVNSTLLPTLDEPAIIHFNSKKGMPLIDSNDNGTFYLCSSSDCTEIFSFNPLRFSVKGFTTYNTSNLSFYDWGQDYDNPVGQGSLQTFSMNLSINVNDTINYATLSWEAQEENATSIAYVNDDGFVANYTVSTQLTLDEDFTGVANFNWTIVTQSGNVGITDNYSQTVSSVNLSFTCDVNSTILINYTLLDEDNQTLANISDNPVIKVDITINQLGSSSIITQSSLLFNNNTAVVCIDPSIVDSGLQYNAIAEYSYDDHELEYNFIQKANITSANVYRNLTLLDLLSLSSTSFTIFYKDSSLIPVSDAVISIQRLFVDEGQKKLVEAPKTDDDGRTIGKLVVGEYYTMIVTKEGSLLSTFNDIIPVCTDAISGECIINLREANTITLPVNYTTHNGIDFLYQADNTGSGVINVIYNSVDGTPKTIRVLGKQTTNYNNVTVCDLSQTSSSGTINCNIPTSSGNSSILLQTYVDGVFSESRSYYIGSGAKDIFGSSTYVLIILLVLSLPLIFIGSEIMMVLGAMLGLVASGWLLLFSGDIVGSVTAITWIILGGMVIVYKLTREESG